MTTPLRPCLTCGRPARGTRCADHRIPPRSSRPHRRARAHVLANATRCHTCGQPPTPGNPLTLGHLVPHSHGGTLDLDNLVAECARCNYSRGAQLPDREGVGGRGVVANSDNTLGQPAASESDSLVLPFL
jgi:5-methylcytosine-specific restriction endonuclease McrA